MSERGRFITFEGTEGVGKSTQVALLADWLEGERIGVVRSREPGGTVTAERIRTLLKDNAVDGLTAETELLLIFAARVEHAAGLIRPALEAGNWVICDRFVDASFAYQGSARGLGDERVAALADWLVPDLVPDLTLWLDLPLAAALARLDERGQRDRFEREDDDFFRRVEAGYEALSRREPQRFRRVDAAGTEQAVHARCRALVMPLLAAPRP